VGGAFRLADKTQVPAARPTHHRGEPRLIDGKFFRIPGSDAHLIKIEHRHVDVRAAIRDDGHGGAADIAGPDADDFVNQRFH